MIDKKNVLCIIPARGGSKGIPYKNIKKLCGKPLIYYTIDVAREIFADTDICVSTDDNQIVETVEAYGLKVPFIRPDYLATDVAGTREVLIHAIEYYKNLHFSVKYDVIVLLQPTSPFRLKKHIEETMNLYDNCDMVVSVKESSANPYYNIFEEDENGLLQISKGDDHYTRRQDAPKVWEYNGSIYVINYASLQKDKISDFTRKKKYLMDILYSIDIDTPLDWVVAEEIIKMNLLNQNKR